MATEFVVVRHAKAEQGTDSDVGRTLSAEGRAQALTLGNWLLTAECIPDLVICSDAARTVQTFEAMRSHLGVFPPIVRLPELRQAAETKEEYDSVIAPLERKLGDDAPFRRYSEQDHAHSILLRQGNKLVHMIREEARRRNALEVLVVGHGINLPVLCMLLAGGEENAFFTERPLPDYAKGYWIHLDGSVTEVG